MGVFAIPPVPEGTGLLAKKNNDGTVEGGCNESEWFCDNLYIS